MSRLKAELDVSFHFDLVGQMVTDSLWKGFDHTHTFDEILYVIKGPITVKTNTQTQRVNRGEFALVPKNTEHKVTAPEPSSFMYLGFHTNSVCFSGTEVCVYPKATNQAFAKLAVVLEQVSQKAQREREPMEKFAGEIMRHLLPVLLELPSFNCSPKDESKVIISNKIKEYVATHVAEPIRVDQIAAGLYLTPHYLGSVFSAVNGVTIKEYTLRYKMNKAIELLGQEGLSVGAVAMRLGYDSPHYFSKCFKEYFGFSPSKYPGKLEEK